MFLLHVAQTYSNICRDLVLGDENKASGRGEEKRDSSSWNWKQAGVGLKHMTSVIGKGQLQELGEWVGLYYRFKNITG